MQLRSPMRFTVAVTHTSLAALILLAAPIALAAAQEPTVQPSARQADDTLGTASDRIRIDPTASDQEISSRLRQILKTTGRFPRLDVQTRGGVVFLVGETRSEEDRRWAGDLARNTEGVAAVMNRIDVTRPSIWDFQPAIDGLRDIARGTVRALPSLVFALLVMMAAVAVAVAGTRAARRVARTRIQSVLLRDLIARSIGFTIILLGLIVAFRVAGLTTVALTVVGGTGILGIVIGIAFRDISENVLASVFLSVQHPFRNGDLIEIQGISGFVQRLTLRATVLMTLDGNHVQIPNATVYKSIIRNFSSNPNRREDFVVGIGYDAPIADAQEIALRVLAEHPAVLREPEPWVLADALSGATVQMRVYFWLDGSKYSWVKVRSSVIRLVKRAFQENGISMPDDQREIIFPRGVPVVMTSADTPAKPPEAMEPRRVGPEEEEVATQSESGLSTEARDIEQQARTARVPEEGDDLLT